VSRQRLSAISEIPTFTFNVHPAMQVPSVKSLGVHIVDQNVNWGCRILSICKKIASALGAVKRILHLVPFNVLIDVYNSLVQPYFDYCSGVWGNCSVRILKKNYRSPKTAQPVFYCMQTMKTILISCPRHPVGENLVTKGF